MNADLLDRLRKDLEVERGSIVDELQSYGADPHSEKVDRIAGINEGFADSAAATTERAEMLSRVASTRDRLASVEDALTRIEEGTYGTCEVCGREISDARLEARPTSTHCIDHA